MRGMSDNLVPLDLSAFSRADLDKIRALGDKLRLLYRWFRYEHRTEPGRESVRIYSGARGSSPYASYRLERRRDGRYALLDNRADETLATGRTLDDVVAAIPDDFYYSN